MRLALFHNLPSGGAKRATFEWINELKGMHEIDLYIFDKQVELTWNLKPIVKNIFIASDTKKINLNNSNKLINLISTIYRSKKLAKKIDNRKYDLVLCMQCKVTNSPYLLRFLKSKSVYICHEPLSRVLEPHYPKKYSNSFFNFFRKLGLRFFIQIDRDNAVSADSILTTSYYSRERLYLCYGVYAKVIYPGVDTTFFKKQKKGIRKHCVLSVGSLFPSKGHDFVINSLSVIDKKIRPNLLIIYGANKWSNKYKNELKALAQKQKVKTTFLGAINDDLLLKAYNSSFLTLCGNHLEPLGLVSLESMACGTPVIAVNEAGLRETIVNLENGILTDRNPLDFSEAIVRLILNKQTWLKMSNKAVKYTSENWSWKISSSNLNQYLKNLIKKNTI
jgi:glycosyltransferase involved in cell wall biosynthesis